MAILICLASVARGQSLTRKRTSSKGTSAAAARQNAIANLPFRSLPSSTAHAVRAVVRNPSIYRRLPIETIDCDPEMLTYLLRNPEIVIGLWQKFGVANVSMQRTGPYSFVASDGIGTISRFQLIHGTPHLHVYYASGQYEGELLKNVVRAQCVLMVRSSARRTSQGRVVITNVVDVFLDMESKAINLAAKTLSPLFTRTSDANLRTTAKFVSQLSHTAEVNPDRINEVIHDLKDVEPPVREGYTTIVSRLGKQRHSEVEPAVVAAATRPNAARVWYPVDTDPPRQIRPREPILMSRFPPEYPAHR